MNDRESVAGFIGTDQTGADLCCWSDEPYLINLAFGRGRQVRCHHPSIALHIPIDRAGGVWSGSLSDEMYDSPLRRANHKVNLIQLRRCSVFFGELLFEIGILVE